ncbi:glycyl-radical enzyme activating protein [Vibrio mangrovi]|uniref:Benzylsuccinate synthase activating enzyme n=1 Tax=Vibrio mangrovi TaxID=474394 RepID=A0A1Y6IPP1_9VIBR|nr:glycyl-radical enzyme activating protein [Vibrio mangrovi]MDW6003591.1 glycyl-radical enzyme activating protein [Vibrio mangrovi]SMR99617.1 Benzylsuccinate synthase activating enzyme [Vibrio mangrovi]
MIFNIQRYSTHDGPGIRTVVFMKGCSLRCRWCQNPESHRYERDLLFDPRLCLSGCTLCQDVVPDVIQQGEECLDIDRVSLSEDHLNALTEVCPAEALTVCGEALDIEDVMQIIRKDKHFYEQSGGGVTLSGGEPFMTPEFSTELLARCKREGLHTAVETCLHVPWKYIEPSLDCIDLFLADLKHVDPDIFRQWTNGNVRRVMSHLEKLSALEKPVVIRVPLVPDFNADEASVKAIVDYVATTLSCKEIHFLPYHTLGKQKYQLLGRPYLASGKKLEDPELLNFSRHYAQANGLRVTLRG